MNEIILKTYELIDEFEKSELIKDLTYYKEKVINNNELKELIEKGKNTEDKYLLLNIRQKLYKNNDYKKYMEKYNELYLIVLKINNKYKEITKSKACNKYE